MFGLKNAPSKFCELITDLIQGLETFVFAYLDDFIVFSISFEEHLLHLKQLFTRINEFGLFVNLKKCVFAKHSVTFLGHTFSVEGMQPLQDKVRAIKQMRPPTTVKEVRRFLGCINYYRPFLPHLAEASSALSELLSVKRGTPKSKTVLWEARQQQAFLKCIKLLADATTLNYEDHSRPLILCTDASLTHAGAVLEQTFESPQGSITKPLAFFSKKFTKNVTVRSTFNRELTAAYFATRYFRHRIYGRRCILKTDHKALVSAIANPSGIHSPNEERMLQFIKEFNLNTIHIEGNQNQVADCLSRPPGEEELPAPATPTIYKGDHVQEISPSQNEDHIQTANCLYRPSGEEELPLSAPPTLFQGDHDHVENDHVQEVSPSQSGNHNKVENCFSLPPSETRPQVPKNFPPSKLMSSTCFAMDAFHPATTSTSSKRIGLKHISLDIIRDEQQKEPDLFRDAAQHLKSSRVKPRPKLCTILTASKKPVHAITTNTGDQPRILLPRSLRIIAFHEAHKILHQGNEKSLDSLSFQYFWPHMKTDVELWVKACPQCQQNKISRHNKQKLQNYPSNPQRLRVLHVDLVCPSTTSYLSYGDDTIGFRYILTMRDRATGFVLAIPIKDKRTATVIWTLFLHYFAIFGPPDIIIADNGLEFASASFHKFCDEQGTKVNHTTAYHPQANGAVERVHRDLKTMLRNLPCTTDWAQHLPLFTMAYNNQACDVNSYTSFQHLFGQPGRLPGHLVNPECVPQSTNVITLHTEAFSELMGWHHRQARPLPAIKHYLDQDLFTCSKVWVFNSAPKGNLAPLYIGPFEVLQKQEKYFLLKQDNVIKPVSIDRLKPFFALPSIPETKYYFRASENRASLKKQYADFVQ